MMTRLSRSLAAGALLAAAATITFALPAEAADPEITLKVPQRKADAHHRELGVLKLRFAVNERAGETPAFTIRLEGGMPFLSDDVPPAGVVPEVDDQHPADAPLATFQLPRSQQGDGCTGRDLNTCEKPLGESQHAQFDNRRKVRIRLLREPETSIRPWRRATHYSLIIYPEEGGRPQIPDMVGDEQFVIGITGADLVGACLEPFDRQPAGQLGGIDLLTPGDNNAPYGYPKFDAFPHDDVIATPTHSCAGWRPGIDVVFVVDRSGSMAQKVDADGGRSDDGKSKMEVARLVLEDFGKVWKSLTEAELLPCAHDPAATEPDNVTEPDRLCGDQRVRGDTFGLVPFSTDADTHLSLPCGAGSKACMSPAIELTESEALSVIRALTPGDLTSICDGLEAAVSEQYLDLENTKGDDSRRRVIILLSDGKATTANYIVVDEDADGRFWLRAGPREHDHELLGVQATAPALNHLVRLEDDQEVGYNTQIYTVVVGHTGVIDGELMTRLAAATGGAYFHVDQAAAVADGLADQDAKGNKLRTFFIHALQNFLRFNTWRIVRDLHTEAFGSTELFDIAGDEPLDYRPGSNRFRIPTTTQALAVIALYDDAGDPDADEHPIELTVTPPPGLELGETVRGNGMARLVMRLPRDIDRRALLDDWRLNVRQDHSDEPLPVRVIVLADTLAEEVDTEIDGKSAQVGERVTIRVRLGVLGEPVTGLDETALHASVYQPEHALGEQLSDPNFNAELLTARERAALGGSDGGSLQTLLGETLARIHPAALARRWMTVALRDDGQGPDAVADDGIYSGDFVARRSGNHEIVTRVDAPHPRVGTLQFQHTEAIHVRDVPLAAGEIYIDDDGESATAPALEVTDTPTDDGVRRTVRLRPVNPFGDALGPGYDGRLVLRTAAGATPLTDVDLDGTYEGQVSLTAALARATDEASPTPDVVFLDRPIPVFADTPPETLDAIAALALPGADGAEPIGVVSLAPTPAIRSEDGGCDCDAGAGAPGGLASLLALAAFGFVIRRRRR